VAGLLAFVLGIGGKRDETAWRRAGTDRPGWRQGQRQIADLRWHRFQDLLLLDRFWVRRPDRGQTSG